MNIASPTWSALPARVESSGSARFLLSALMGRARHRLGDRLSRSVTGEPTRCRTSRAAGPGKEVSKHGAVGDDAHELLEVIGRRIVAQLGHRPLPAIARRLQGHANH